MLTEVYKFTVTSRTPIAISLGTVGNSLALAVDTTLYWEETAGRLGEPPVGNAVAVIPRVKDDVMMEIHWGRTQSPEGFVHRS
jgi:hypothetical protein